MMRGRRSMPTMTRLLAHYGIPADDPYCFKCLEPVPDITWLQRAHVIDRVVGGLDNLANLRPLCEPCHRHQPIFRPEDEAQALAWFSDRAPALVGVVGQAMEKIAHEDSTRYGCPLVAVRRWMSTLLTNGHDLTLDEWIRFHFEAAVAS